MAMAPILCTQMLDLLCLTAICKVALLAFFSVFNINYNFKKITPPYFALRFNSKLMFLRPRVFSNIRGFGVGGKAELRSNMYVQYNSLPYFS